MRAGTSGAAGAQQVEDGVDSSTSKRNGNEDTGLAPRAKYVIDLAVDEARRWNHNYVGTEHLLFGLVREGEGIAARTLKAMGASQERLRKLSLDRFGRLDTI